MRLKNQVPNILTFVNLLLGFLSIIFSVNNQFTLASFILLLAVVFDFLDGKVARLLKLESVMGEHLDSLADLVSFGVAPAVLMYSVFRNNYLLILLVLYVGASAFRLARFNVMKKKVDGFLGMPITINGLIFPILFFVNASLKVVMILFIISGVLMVSTLRFRKVI
ncbi:MAG: CDP-diacylglycerol--serine O-phosphatidyltransferase [Nanoarchaeota archaeon]|nr:CDP-diacylglycerol--serine O-phosphatidyltransferase [Nanoarchaeota archaeon]